MATKQVEMPPTNMLKEEKYFLKGYQPPYKVFDKTRSVSTKDMNTNVQGIDRKISPKSRKVFIEPLKSFEKSGPFFGQ